MTEIATTQSTTVGAFDRTDLKVLEYLGLRPDDPRSRAVVAVAQHYNLDPLLKHIVIIPGGGIYITRDGLLHTAHDSKQLDGIVVEQEPTLSEDGREWVARVSVYRKDMRFPFTFPGRYPVRGGNAKHAPEMALKCAEAHALRRAFDVTGLPAEDEMQPEQPQQRVTAADIAPQQEAAPGSFQRAPEPPADEPVDAEIVDPDAEAAAQAAAETHTGGE